MITSLATKEMNLTPIVQIMTVTLIQIMTVTMVTVMIKCTTDYPKLEALNKYE